MKLFSVSGCVYLSSYLHPARTSQKRMDELCEKFLLRDQNTNAFQGIASSFQGIG